MTVSFRIPYPASEAGRKEWNRRFGLNSYWSGKHWTKRRGDAEYWHFLVRAEMDRQGVRKRPFDRPVSIAMYFNDRLDCSNHAIYFKLTEDAMKGRVIRDDSRRWVKGCEVYFHDEDCIRVEVREYRGKEKI